MFTKRYSAVDVLLNQTRHSRAPGSWVWVWSVVIGLGIAFCQGGCKSSKSDTALGSGPGGTAIPRDASLFVVRDKKAQFLNDQGDPIWEFPIETDVDYSLYVPQQRRIYLLAGDALWSTPFSKKGERFPESIEYVTTLERPANPCFAKKTVASLVASHHDFTWAADKDGLCIQLTNADTTHVSATATLFADLSSGKIQTEVTESGSEQCNQKLGLAPCERGFTLVSPLPQNVILDGKNCALTYRDGRSIEVPNPNESGRENGCHLALEGLSPDAGYAVVSIFSNGVPQSKKDSQRTAFVFDLEQAKRVEGIQHPTGHHARVQWSPNTKTLLIDQTLYRLQPKVTSLDVDTSATWLHES